MVTYHARGETAEPPIVRGAELQRTATLFGAKGKKVHSKKGMLDE